MSANGARSTELEVSYHGTCKAGGHFTAFVFNSLFFAAIGASSVIALTACGFCERYLPGSWQRRWICFDPHEKPISLELFADACFVLF